MTKWKRKRGQPRSERGAIDHRPAKKARGDRNGQTSQASPNRVDHSLLSRLYPNLRTLRQHILSKLPGSSRLRRKKFASLGLKRDPTLPAWTDVELNVARLLDTTIVACTHEAVPSTDTRREQWISFSQKNDESYVTLSGGFLDATICQAEIVHFVIWLLFSREKKTGSRPQHLLCDGFRKDINPASHARATSGTGNEIPGLFSLHTNYQVQALKTAPWPQVLTLLGRSGEQIMIDLLLDCSIFISVGAGRENFYQLSGASVSGLDYFDTQHRDVKAAISPCGAPEQAPGARCPSSITFVRSRMLYARAALNARGLVQFGLKHIHVLNRFPLKRRVCRAVDRPAKDAHGSTGTADQAAMIRVMMYMFPRQFRLHNVFTSIVDRSQTAQKFQDYTLREEEISTKFGVCGQDQQNLSCRIPKRLRGLPSQLVQRLQVLHARCSYSKLLAHYCPAHGQLEMDSKPRSIGKATSLLSKAQSRQAKARMRSRQNLLLDATRKYNSIVDLATPTAHVSAFCRAVLSKIIPPGFWGSDTDLLENEKAFLKSIDHFLHLRRFEQLTLHDVVQDLKITGIEWLTPPTLQGQKCSQTDRQKRLEIFYEFLYYVFDSILIPLIRTNFYVTESSTNRYRLLFFRHDIWRYVAEPAMAALKTKMFEEVNLNDALQILSSRKLGFSQVRLLPKGLSMRPIMNLRRRMLGRREKKTLGPSINSILGPVNSMLKLEKTLHPERLGSAMFSVGDIYRRIKNFKSKILPQGNSHFYIVKVDVVSAFDTIPQEAIVDLMCGVPTRAGYKFIKHAEVHANDAAQSAESRNKPVRKWQNEAITAEDRATFAQMLENRLATHKKNTVFVENVVRRKQDSKALTALLASHVQQNLVKIGKKFYRQKCGIPQGSILSSTLCNYFYADLEMSHLDFLLAEDSLLLRLIDDFLLITTDKGKAQRFVDTMYYGFPEYGVNINISKSLVNFDMTVDNVAVPKIGPTKGFPYCGVLINGRTLDISKDREKKIDLAVFDSLTVEFSRCPGQNFKRKVLNAFKIQSHLMFFDSSYNSRPTTLSNIYTAFVETATKSWAYARCLPRDKRPSPRLITDAITHLIEVSFLLLSSKSRAARYPGYQSTVRKSHVAWLALVAFRQVLSVKQANFRDVIKWLDEKVQEISSQKGVDCRSLVQVIKIVS